MRIRCRASPSMTQPAVARSSAEPQSSGEMNVEPPTVAGVESCVRLDAYALRPQLDANADSAELIARSDPIAAASLLDIRARSSPGTAIAAMTPMIAITISSSIRVNPRFRMQPSRLGIGRSRRNFRGRPASPSVPREGGRRA